MEEDIRNLVAHDNITIMVRLSEDEMLALEDPPTLYFSVPRLGYLHSIVNQAHTLLQHLLPPGDDTTWFDYNMLPLKWNVPIGVLYDLLVLDQSIPWRLTLHFRNFPSSVLPLYSSEATLRASFKTSLKEASQIRIGRAQKVMSMVGRIEDGFWEAVLQCNMPQVRQILQSIDLDTAFSAGANSSGATAEHKGKVPVRVYARLAGSLSLTSYEGVGYISRDIPVIKGNEDGPVTLLDALSVALQGFWPGKGAPSDSGDIAARLASVLVGGVAVPLNTPIMWLHTHFHAPDFFLYIVVFLN